MDNDPSSISALLLQTHPDLQADGFGRWGALILSLVGVLFLGWLAGLMRSAFFLVTPGQAGLLRARNDFTGQQIAYLHEDQRRLLLTFLLLQSLAYSGIFLVWADALAFGHGLQAWLWLGGLFLLMAVVGILVPPVQAVRQQQMALQTYSFWVLVAHRILGPLTLPYRKLAQAMGQGGGAVSMPEEDGPDAGQASPGVNDEGEILRGIARFPTIQVRQVMTSRRDTVGILVGQDYHEVMDTINKAGYTRYPVYTISPDTHGPDEVAGILYSKDLLAYTSEGEDFNWQAFLRPAYFCPENKRIDELLRTFQERKTHVAIVIDEFGGVRGLVTLEDILEEIVGEIQDEFDEEDQGWRQLEDNVWEFEGRTALNDLFRTTDVDPSAVQDDRGNSETVAGLVLEVSQSMPRTGEVVEVGPFRFTVLAASRRQIKRVRVEVLESEE